MESKNYHEDLSHIRNMMEKSSRFISLSGLSGVFAGITALIGAFYVYSVFEKNGISYFDGDRNILSKALVQELFWVGLIILTIAVGCGYFFTARNSKKKGQKIWDSTVKKLLFNFSIPLVTGGFFCIALQMHHLFVFIAPVTLLFYGLALLQASRYTVTDVQYLGYLEIILGLLSLFFLGWGLVFWAIGFGVLHIVYGIVIYKKYE